MRALRLLIILALFIPACAKDGAPKIGLDLGVRQSPLPGGGAIAQVDGTINGGGGKAVICTKGGVQTVETLDLYEAHSSSPGLTLIDMPDDAESAIAIFADRIAKQRWNTSTIPIAEFKAVLIKEFRKRLAEIEFLKDGQSLKFVPDSHEVIHDHDCHVVQVAAYYGEALLLVDLFIWNQMRWRDRIALFAHELVYLMARQNGETDSISTRRFIGRLFSTAGIRAASD